MGAADKETTCPTRSVGGRKAAQHHVPKHSRAHGSQELPGCGDSLDWENQPRTMVVGKPCDTLYYQKAFSPCFFQQLISINPLAHHSWEQEPCCTLQTEYGSEQGLVLASALWDSQQVPSAAVLGGFQALPVRGRELTFSLSLLPSYQV